VEVSRQAEEAGRQRVAAVIVAGRAGSRRYVFAAAFEQVRARC